MFKRIIKIILILLAVFLLILGIIWLIGRHKAEKAGTKELSFKQFIGLSSKESSTGNLGNGGTLSSSFTGNGSGNGANGTSGNGGNGNGAENGASNQGWNDVTNTSNFTNGGISPTGNTNGGGGGNGNGTGTGDTNSNTNKNGSGSSDGTDGTGGASTAPSCGVADTTITFTPDELTQLNNLQNRFYSLAQTLHTDEDVATELANHDAFDLKADQVTEMYNYCQSQISTPAFTSNTQLERRVATPFWDAWNVSWNPVTNLPSSITAASDSKSFFDVTAYCSGFPDPSSCISHIESSQGLQDDAVSSCGSPGANGYIDCIKTAEEGIITQGTLGLLNFANPSTVPITGSALGDTGILIPVIDRILRVNIW